MGIENSMEALHEENIGCPYCGEIINVLIDPSDVDQQYIEDCQVCCRPITFSISADYEGNLLVDLQGENEG